MMASSSTIRSNDNDNDRFDLGSPASQKTALSGTTAVGIYDKQRGGGSSSTGLSPAKQKSKRRVITKPSWARESSEEEGESKARGAASSRNPSNSIASSKGTLRQIPSPSSGGGGGGGGAAGPATATASNSSQDQGDHPLSATEGERRDSSESEHTTPARFWTFTLPTKYRNRLHEHHIRQLRSDMLARTSNKTRNTRRDSDSSSIDAPPPATDSPGQDGLKSPSASGRPPIGSPKASRRWERDRRVSAGGWGDATASEKSAAAWAGAEGGVMNWRKRQNTVTTPGILEHGQEDASRDGHRDEESERPRSESRPRRRSTDPERDVEADPNDSSCQYENGRIDFPATEMRVRMSHDHDHISLTRQQAETPGWASPWRPESMHGAGAIEVGGYTFPSMGDGVHFYPRTDVKSSANRKRGVFSRRRLRGGTSKKDDIRIGKRAASFQITKKGIKTQRDEQSWLRANWEEAKEFLLRNPFVPLLFRIINLCFTTATLALAIQLFITLRRQGASDAVGSSPLVAIIFAPFSIIHVGGQVWIEYMSSPVHWSRKSKLSYQLIEVSSSLMPRAHKKVTLTRCFFPPPRSSSSFASGRPSCPSVSTTTLPAPWSVSLG